MSQSPELVLRRATTGDASVLTELNRQLIEDQGHDNPATRVELEERMRRWLSGGYSVGLFECADVPVAYAVWREGDDGIYLRQLFVVREQRRHGIGRQAFTLLRRQWNTDEVKLDVLLHNERALAFWRSLGFHDYALILRLLPEGAT